MLDLAIVHSPVGGGHKAAALAVAEAARARGLTAEVIDLFALAPRLFGGSYVAAHLAAQGALPDLYGTAFAAANRRGGAFEPLRLGFDRVVYAGLLAKIAELAPRAIVATHHLPLVVLGQAREQGRLQAPVIGVVTDYVAHACWAERGVDAFCVPCDSARGELAAHGVPGGRIATTGIPVRPAFDGIAPLRSPARDDEPLRVLVTSGGFGVGPMRRIVRSFSGMREAELTVVCGNARGLVRRVQRDAARFEVRAKVIGFERDMPARMAEAHVIVGKGGGLTVSEAMTAGRPMVVVGAVPGNEKVNERRVVEAGAGWAAPAAHVGPICGWMRRASLIEAMGARARALVPSHSADRVLDVAIAMSSFRRAA